ncbi:MAG: hypothetical protein M3437_04950 [Chloroflexota bacterium]|nr:hypothetical protein [Chloroflexota bacterium]MDQ5866539.1 hypothetical protein [Chloroflexota bacterium]
MPSTRAAGEAQGAPTVPMSMLAQEALPPDDSTPTSPDTVDSLVAEDLEIAPTTLLTLGEMLARQPEQDVLFHPCEQCGLPIRGEASHCDECAALEEAEALSRDEKARHERHMSLVRKGVVVTVLVTIFGTYFWFNDPSKLLDGLLPGIFGPTQEAEAGKVAHAEVLPSPFAVATLSPLPSGTTGSTATTGSQVVGALNTPATATLSTPVARQNGPALPTVTGVPTPSAVVQDAFTAPTARPGADEVVVLPSASASPLASAFASATSTSTTTRPQPTQTRAERVASTPTPTRLPPTAAPRRSPTPTRTLAPLPSPTGTPTPLRPTVVPTQGTVAAPTSTPTTLPVLPTLTPALPTVTVALPTVTVALPTLTVLPTEVRLPEATVPVVPTVDVPTVDVPSVPTVASPTDVVPTVPPPTVPAAPEPTTIVPTVVPPTVPVPTAQVPTVAASAVPTDLPVVATPTVQGGQQQVVPTVTVPVALP